MIQVNSFISNFKKIKRIVFIVSILLCIWIGFLILEYLYVDGSEVRSRTMMHQFYNEEENIDNLYLGSSHIYASIIPTVLDELNGENNFALSMSAQRMRGSYYLLKEAGQYHDIKTVYLEMYYRLSISENGEEQTNLSAEWNCLDYMSWSKNKIEYLTEVLSENNFFDTLFPFLRYRSKLFDKEYVYRNIQNKSSEAYKNYQYVVRKDDYVAEYKEKGYFYTTQEYGLDERVYDKKFNIEETPINKETEEYLIKIIEYCEQNDIELVLFSSPIYELEMLAVQHYDEYVKQLKAICNKFDVEYYDFNLVKNEVLPLEEASYYMDINHLNEKGAEIFTRFFNAFVQMTDEQKENCFYNTYDEKLSLQPTNVYGILYVGTDDEQELWRAAANKNSEVEYRIILTPENGDTVMLQDFNENAYFPIESGQQGICTIVWREKGNELVSTIELRYE